MSLIIKIHIFDHQHRYILSSKACLSSSTKISFIRWIHPRINGCSADLQRGKKYKKKCFFQLFPLFIKRKVSFFHHILLFFKSFRVGDAKRHKSCQIILNYDKETNNMSKETKKQRNKQYVKRIWWRNKHYVRGKYLFFSNSNPMTFEIIICTTITNICTTITNICITITNICITITIIGFWNHPPWQRDFRYPSVLWRRLVGEYWVKIKWYDMMHKTFNRDYDSVTLSNIRLWLYDYQSKHPHIIYESNERPRQLCGVLDNQIQVEFAIHCFHHPSIPKIHHLLLPPSYKSTIHPSFKSTIHQTLLFCRTHFWHRFFILTYRWGCDDQSGLLKRRLTTITMKQMTSTITMKQMTTIMMEQMTLGVGSGFKEPIVADETSATFPNSLRLHWCLTRPW